MTKRRYSAAFVSALLAEVARGERPLREVLEERGVPERTYHHWRRHFPLAGDQLVPLVRELRREANALRRRNAALEQALALQREALGKPWRRPLPGGPPSPG